MLSVAHSARLHFASLVSILGHPLLVVPLTVAVTTRNWRWTAIIAATTAIPLTAVILRRVRRGTFSDFDVSRRDQRAGLYHLGFAFLAVAAATLYLFGAPRPLFRGVAAATAMFALGLLGNRWLKISLHMMLAAYCAVIITRVYPSTLPPIALFALAIAWSRHALGRHTIPELITGTLIGLAGGWWVIG